MKRQMKTQGFTLFEVLTSLGLFLLMIGMLFSSLNISIDTSKDTSNQSQMQLDSQAANLLIGNRLKESIYIYPAGSTLTLPNKGHMRNHIRSNAGTNWITGNTTGQDPYFLAFITPPQDPTIGCATSTTGCFVFYAYYPVPRAQLLATPDISPLQRPNNEAANQNQWVLMEYRSLVAAGGITVDNTFKVTAPPVSSSVANGEARMLLDLIRPNGLQFTIDQTNLDVTLSYQLQNLSAPINTYPVTGNATVVFHPRNWQ